MDTHAVIVPVRESAPARSAEQVLEQRQAAMHALEYAAELAGAPATDWQQDDEGIPIPQDGFRWSIAHKPLFAAAVVAKEQVGIDIEAIKPRHPDSLAEIATDAEWSLFPARSWHQFFRIWTAKEAVLKALGIGVAGLPSCSIDEVADDSNLTVRFRATPWRVHQHCRNGHLAAVAIGSGTAHWHFKE